MKACKTAALGRRKLTASAGLMQNQTWQTNGCASMQGMLLNTAFSVRPLLQRWVFPTGVFRQLDKLRSDVNILRPKCRGEGLSLRLVSGERKPRPPSQPRGREAMLKILRATPIQFYPASCFAEVRELVSLNPRIALSTHLCNHGGPSGDLGGIDAIRNRIGAFCVDLRVICFSRVGPET